MNPTLARYFTFRNFYLFLMLVIVVSLPLSKFLSSASQILLVALWLAEGKYDEKWRRLKMNPQVLIFTLLFFIPLAGMIYTEDTHFGMGDLRVKLPLFLLPVVLGSIPPFDAREMRILLGGFVAAVFAGCLVSLSIMLGIGPLAYTGDRESVLFISHIRFSLMVVLAVFIMLYYAFTNRPKLLQTLVLLGGALLLILFLFLLKSLTGVVILIVGGLLLALRQGIRLRDPMVRWFLIVGMATVPVLAGLYLSSKVSNFYTIKDAEGPQDTVTVKGNPYVHDSTMRMIENGYHVGYYWCEPELREAWNSVSKLDYAGKDRKGQEIKYTLVRYLTSLGLRKDAYGVSQLKPDDIRLIGEGYANCIYKNPKRFSVRIYETIWEIDQYRKGSNPSGHSVTQRLEYLKTGWAIFRDHPVFGVGTGDTKISFDRKYEELRSPLDPHWRLRAHNQYLTFLISYGIIGFLLIMGAIILPVVLTNRKNSYFIMMFLVIALLSMLNEDTLESQAGVAFFAVFYSLFLFADRGDGVSPAGSGNN